MVGRPPGACAATTARAHPKSHKNTQTILSQTRLSTDKANRIRTGFAHLLHDGVEPVLQHRGRNRINLLHHFPARLYRIGVLARPGAAQSTTYYNYRNYCLACLPPALYSSREV